MSIGVLHADADSDVLETATAKLAEEHRQFEVTAVQRADAAFEAFDDDEQPVDCLVIGDRLLNSDTLGFVRDVRQEYPDVPVIHFTDRERDAIASDVLAAGATDFLKKGGDEAYRLLATRIEAFAERYRASRQSSNLYQAVETASEGIGLIGDDGRYLYLNEAYADLYGYDRDELLGMHWEQLYPADEAERFREEILPELKEQGSWDGYSRGKHATGELFSEKLSLTHIDGDGHVCVVRDVSDRQRRKQQFETLANNLQGMVYRCRNTSEWPIVFAQGNVESLLGYTIADLKAQAPSWNQLIHPDDRERAWDKVQAATDNAEQFEITYRVVDEDGQTKWVIDRGRGVEADDGTVKWVDGLVTEITERKRYELELEWKTNAMDEAPMGIVISDPSQPDNPLIYANDGFSEMTGYSEADALGRNCRFLEGPLTDPESVERIQTAIEDRRPVEVDLLNYRKEKTPFWNNVQVSPITDADGRLTHFVWFQNDITARVESERRIEILHRVLRHNLRNNLSVVLGNLEGLRENPDVDDATLEAIRAPVVDLLETSEKARKIRVWLESASFDPEQISIEHIIERAFSHGRSINTEAELQADVDPDLSVLAPESVTVAFRELVENAIVHSAESPPSVSVWTEPSTIAFEHESTPTEAVTVHIEDTNVSIPDIDQARLLGDEESSVHHGTGLGLWLVNWLVTMSGGLIEHSKRDDGGNSVSITLLRADD